MRSKAKGTRAETAVVNHLISQGLPARRKALKGSADEGDVETCGIALEVKAGKQTANPNRGQLTEWLRQAAVESEHSGQRCVLVVKRYNRRIEDADVWEADERGGERHWHLDEFIERELRKGGGDEANAR